MSELINPDPIEGFTDEARRRLRRHLSPQRLLNVVDEARSHMREREAQLITSGMPPTQARERAVAAFGSPHVWSRSIVSAFYDDNWTIKANFAAIGAATITLLGYILSNCQNELPLPNSLLILVFALTCAGAVVLAVASFRARRFATKPVAAIGLSASLLLFIVYGLTCVSIQDLDGGYTRQEIPQIIKAYQQSAVQPAEDLKLLQLGHLTFREVLANPATPIPAELRSDGGYIVPLPFNQLPNGVPVYWESAFKKPLIASSGGNVAIARQAKQIEAETPYRTVPKISEAAAIYESDGSKYMLMYSVEVEDCKRLTGQYREALTRSHRFDPYAGWYGARIALPAIAALLAVNWLFAGIGRRAFRRQNNRPVVA